ncbi:hypothetical protein PUN4_180071 [Paraburkholderia unamae]|nr:hypothetical protein PUN4_180071 [Paraburkholderia unamae]
MTGRSRTWKLLRPANPATTNVMTQPAPTCLILDPFESLSGSKVNGRQRLRGGLSSR